jgi:uncharacterized membrane protein
MVSWTRRIPETVPVPGLLEDITYTGQFKKMVTLSHVYNEVTSELQTRDIQQLLGKLPKFVIDAG